MLIVPPFVPERGRAIGIAIKALHPTGQGLLIDMDWICRLLFTFVTPSTDARVLPPAIAPPRIGPHVQCDHTPVGYPH